MNNTQKPIARHDKIVVQDLEKETLIYDLEANKAFCLNESSKLIWQLCDGKRTVSEISDEMSKQTKNLVSEDLVWLALDQFSKDGLLENSDGFGEHFSGFSRREVIKKVGFASAIALPIISSLVAPHASMAQSMLAVNGQACTPLNNALCGSNNCLSAGGGAGICCEVGSTQGNSPGYNICTTDGSAAAFAFRCCSGNASPAGGAPCPVGETRYVCNPYQ